MPGTVELKSVVRRVYNILIKLFNIFLLNIYNYIIIIFIIPVTSIANIAKRLGDYGFYRLAIRGIA